MITTFRSDFDSTKNLPFKAAVQHGEDFSIVFHITNDGVEVPTLSSYNWSAVYQDVADLSVYYEIDNQDVGYSDGNVVLNFRHKYDLGAIGYRIYLQGENGDEVAVPAFAEIGMLPNPLFSASHVEPVPPTIDFSQYNLLNAPWSQLSDLEALSASLSNYIPTSMSGDFEPVGARSYTDEVSAVLSGEIDDVRDGLSVYAEKTWVEEQIAEIPEPPVSSVNGKTGAVTLSASDVSALATTGGTVDGNVTIQYGDLVIDYTANFELRGSGGAVAPTIWFTEPPLEGGWARLAYDGGQGVENHDVKIPNTSGMLALTSDIDAAISAKADTSALASYLPLSGGTVTGEVLFTAPPVIGDSAYIAFSDNLGNETGYYYDGIAIGNDWLEFPSGKTGTFALDSDIGMLPLGTGTTLSTTTLLYATTLTADASGTASVVVDYSNIPTSNSYFCFEMEIAVPVNTLSVSWPSGWTWVDTAPTAAISEGKTVHLACRLDCREGHRDITANTWEIA